MDKIKKEIIKIENNGINLDKNNKENFGDFIKKGKELLKRLDKNKEKVKILIPIAIISSAIMIYMIIRTIYVINQLNKESFELHNIENYNLKNLENSEYTSNIIKNSNTISELIKYELELSEEIKKYNNYLSKLQKPYENLMKNIFLPDLNIRKKQFVGGVDTSIVGQNFLEKNPYNDIKLIQKRGDFVKNVGDNNEFNEVNDILIGNITEHENYFYIPMTIKFIANSKRSFLLLIEKLSITSNQRNISLINEFIYNLRENLKTDKANEIDIITQEINEKYNKNFDEDEIIGYHLYEWIFQDKKNKLIDDELINKTIKEITLCQNNEDAYCFYQFRDKYRSISTLAYTIGIEKSKNKTEDLKLFLKELPPIIKINTFNFQRDIQQNIINYENTQYKGEIQMNIYGKGISEDEKTEIAQVLGEKCIGKILSPKEALENVDNTLINIGNMVQTDTYSTSNLRELQTILEEINKNYNNMSNYNQVIKLFEIYRMLKDNNLCK